MKPTKDLIPNGTFVYRLWEYDSVPYIEQGVIIEGHRYPQYPGSQYGENLDEYDIRWLAGVPDNVIELHGYIDSNRVDSFELDPEVIAKEWLDWANEVMPRRLKELKDALAAGRVVVYPREEEQ